MLSAKCIPGPKETGRLGEVLFEVTQPAHLVLEQNPGAYRAPCLLSCATCAPQSIVQSS